MGAKPRREHREKKQEGKIGPLQHQITKPLEFDGEKFTIYERDDLSPLGQVMTLDPPSQVHHQVHHLSS